MKGDGNSVNYKYRMHDPRNGRFFAIDPLTSKYPFYSPYSFSGNRVIDCGELEGLEPIGKINDETGEPYHKEAFSLVFPTGETVIVFQNGSYAITEIVKSIMEKMGYKFTEVYNRYESTYMTSNANSYMQLFVGGNSNKCSFIRKYRTKI